MNSQHQLVRFCCKNHCLFKKCRQYAGIYNYKRWIRSQCCNSYSTMLAKTSSCDKESHNLNSTSSLRESPIKIQMLSSQLHNQIFGSLTPQTPTELEREKEDIEKSIDHLQRKGLWGKQSSVIKCADFDLPPFEHPHLLKHFNIIGDSQCEPYKNLLNNLISKDIANLPSTWVYAPGWTRYNIDGSTTPVEYPDCKALVFDVEVCVTDGLYPTLATALSDKYWYSWCSKKLIDNNTTKEEINFNDLIPMEPSEKNEDTIPRVIIGHNVSYDRLRIKEQFYLAESSIKFIDTMSLHIASCGYTNSQRALILKNEASDTNTVWEPWMGAGSTNGLSKVYQFHCKPKQDLAKDNRSIFVKGNLDDIRSDFQNLMIYCANDVKATHQVLTKLLPIFIKRFPSPVSFAGMMEMGSTFLPINSNWEKYIAASETEYNKYKNILSTSLVDQAKKSLESFKDDQYKQDLWLWNLDWEIPKGKVKHLPGFPNWYRKLCIQYGIRDGTSEPERMSISLKIVPKLLKLTWNGYPLHHEIKYGWGYLEPTEQVDDKEMKDYIENNNDGGALFPLNELKKLCAQNISSTIDELHTQVTENEFDGFFDDASNITPTTFTKKLNPVSVKKIDIGIPGVSFIRLPHKDGTLNNVGNPLAKDFLIKLEDKTLSSQIVKIAEQVLCTTKNLTYWRNNRDRILSQMLVWSDHQNLPEKVKCSPKYNVNENYGVILPQVITSGTITRRAVEKTWMTASNAYEDRIGSELKSMIQAPPGYHFVGADVDSQELWIAAVLGDAYFASIHGGTAFGWMTLQGNKADGTDMHSRTAAAAGISRDQAKIINYGRIYGAGVSFVTRLLQKFNPKLSEKMAKTRAFNLMASTKGEKAWYLSELGEKWSCLADLPYSGEPLSRGEIKTLIKRCQKLLGMQHEFEELTNNDGVWVGGSESYMFNCLEAIVKFESVPPSTPILGAHITQTLEPLNAGSSFMTSRTNWVVQSSAVDYLHLILVTMKWLMKKYNIDGRFSISIHDEVRYLVASEDRYRAALALQIANVLTRSMFSIRLGMRDLPQSVAFFSSVDIDTVLRKEPHMDCVTISNPKGLLRNYGIPPGESLDINQILEITGGKLEI